MKFVSTKVFYCSILCVTACGGGGETTPAVVSSPPVAAPAPSSILLPIINQVEIVNSTIERYKKLELRINLSGTYNNPYDSREVTLSGSFTSPVGTQMQVPGYWDGQDWRMRFTPPSTGQWQYILSAQDNNGLSQNFTGDFSVEIANDTPAVATSTSGWIQAGNQFDPSYSSRYFVHHDGSPFYGVGHADAFAIFNQSIFNTNITNLFRNMVQAKENYIVWWPQFYFSVVEDNFDQYHLANVELIDSMLEEFERAGFYLVFTIWDHSQLRDANHPWGNDNYSNNGFSRLVSATDFFTDEESWVWQQNLYRYMIARWGYSTAIAMWQTVSESNGTNAFEHTNTWHEKVNQYFVENDPYRHPTTASMSGDLTWDQGHLVMDSPQVHIYQDLLSTSTNKPNIINSAQSIASYTQNMWELTDKPNWIGEFGVQNSSSNQSESVYPELFHNAIWAALASGSAMTPAEWNDFDSWQTMTTEMKAHISYLSDFVATTPLAQWAPEQLVITSNDSNIRGWGIAGEKGGLIWLQDTQHAGMDISQIRLQRTPISGNEINIKGLPLGQYEVFAFNTWQGGFDESFDINCDQATENGCLIPLPTFTSDIALRIQLK